MANKLHSYFSGGIDHLPLDMLKGSLIALHVSHAIFAGADPDDISRNGFIELADKASYQTELNELKELFASSASFEEKTDKLNALTQKYKHLKELEELIIDQLFLNFFLTSPVARSSHFMETPEGLALQELLQERGTPVIDIYMYLYDLRTRSEKAGIDDFLENYLLINSEEFAEDAEKYADIISNRNLVSESSDTILSESSVYTYSALDDPPFLPLMIFFHAPDDTRKLLSYAGEPAFRHPLTLAALYSVIAGYNGYASFPEKIQIFDQL